LRSQTNQFKEMYVLLRPGFLEQMLGYVPGYRDASNKRSHKCSEHGTHLLDCENWHILGRNSWKSFSTNFSIVSLRRKI